MRHIGTLSDSREAQTFGDYLLTRGVKAKVEADNNQWAIWVLDEDDVATAKSELAEFRAKPDDSRYADSSQKAADLRDQAVTQAIEARKNVVNVRRRWDRPVSARAPVTFVLIIVSVTVAVATHLGNQPNQPVFRSLCIVDYQEPGRFPKGRHEHDEPREIRNGEIWRLVTPIFLHFDLMHIFFNMMWLRELGTAIELRRGSLRFLGMVLAMAAASNFAQYWWAGPAFGGMSGVNFGLFGYIWVKGKFEPEVGLYMPPSTALWMMAFFALCLTPAIGRVANTAHTAGLLMGVLIAYVPVAWRRVTGR